MDKLREELQKDLDRIYPGANIDTEHTVDGPVHIRFELGGENNNGTKKRVKQAANRALTLFNETFNNSMNKIWILIYEYEGNRSNEYLHSLFEIQDFSKFYNKREQINSRYFIEDENGNSVLEKIKAKIIIGRLEAKNIQADKIFSGIANLEMGFDPRIPQIIKFIDPLTANGFYMYDDRGCFVWSNTADKIRDIYIKYNDWIVQYHKPEIDEYFN